MSNLEDRVKAGEELSQFVQINLPRDVERYKQWLVFLEAHNGFSDDDASKIVDAKLDAMSLDDLTFDMATMDAISMHASLMSNRIRKYIMRRTGQTPQCTGVKTSKKPW